MPAENVSLFWKGRVALYAILRALGPTWLPTDPS
jgi:hypothetical protein